MDKAAPARWIGRHPVVWASVFALGMGAGPTAHFVSSPSMARGVLAMIALVAGAGFGLLNSVFARDATDRDS